MRCVICGNELNRRFCPMCGFDPSQDRERHPTTIDDGQRPEAVRVKRERWLKERMKLQAQQPDNTTAQQPWQMKNQTPAPQDEQRRTQQTPAPQDTQRRTQQTPAPQDTQRRTQQAEAQQNPAAQQQKIRKCDYNSAGSQSDVIRTAPAPAASAAAARRRKEKEKRGAPVWIVIAAGLIVIIAGIALLVSLGKTRGTKATDTSFATDTSLKTTTQTTNNIEEEQIAAALQEAEALAANEDYEGALATVKDALSSYPESEALRAKEIEYEEAAALQVKTKTLAEAAQFADSYDYVSAIQLMTHALETNPDDADYKSAYDNYCFSYISDAIAEADNAAGSGEYLSAIELLNHTVSVVGEDKQLSKKITEYTNAYVSGVIEEAEEHLADLDFSAASNLVEEALAQFPDNPALKEEKEKILLQRNSDLDNSPKEFTLGTDTINDSGENNTSQDAQQFVPGDTISGSIAPSEDMDYYVFTIPYSGRVQLDITSYMRYYTLVLYDTSGSVLWNTEENEYNSTVGFREDVYNLDLDSGTYYLRVTGYYYGESHASTGDYSIKTFFTSAKANEIESNNRADAANRVALGETIQGFIGINDRFDFYTLTLSESGRVRLDITSYMRYYTMVLYNTSGSVLWNTEENEYNSTVGFREDVYNLDLDSGTYYLRVTGYYYGESHASTGTYTIKTAFAPANANEAESNNSVDAANPVALGDTICGFIAINDRFDFYALTLSESHKLKLDITSYMRYYTLVLYNASGVAVWDTDENEYNKTSGFRSDSYEIDLGSGTYYLRVTGYYYGESYASTGTYEIHLN